MDWIPILFVAFKGSVLFIGMFYAIKWHYDQDRKDKVADGDPQSPVELRLFATMLIAFTLSVVGVVYAAFWGTVAEGGRGGAIACAFTVLMFVMSKPDAEAVLNGRNSQPSPEQSGTLPPTDPATLSESLDQLAKLRLQTQQLRAAMVFTLESAQREKIYISIAAAMSMLAWKFGDMAAGWLGGGFSGH